MEQKELEVKYLQYQYLMEQARSLEAQFNELLKALEELSVLKHGLENIKEAEEGQELLVPLGASVFVKASLKEKNRVIVGIGADIFVEKEIEEAIPLVDKQIELIKKKQEEISQQLSKLNAEIKKIAKEINDAVVGAHA